jgi:hypothetical protein
MTNRNDGTAIQGALVFGALDKSWQMMSYVHLLQQMVCRASWLCFHEGWV